MDEGKPGCSYPASASSASGGLLLGLDLTKCITSGRKPEQRGGHSAVLAQGKLIVFGGHRYEKESRFRYFNDTYVLDLATLTWKEVLCHGDVIAPRYGHSATLVGTRMFVLGGKGQDGALYRDVNVLDLKTWTWAPVTSQSVGPSPRMGHASLLVGRKIVIHGGWDGKLTCNGELWVFDTETFSWLQPSVGGLPPSPRFGHSLALVDDGRILLFGGSTISSSKGSPEYLDDLRELDTESLLWTRSRTIGHGPSARYYHTATVLDGSRMVIYGGWGVGGMQCVEANPRPGAESLFILDATSSTWYVPRPSSSAASNAPQGFHKYGHTVCVDPSLGLVVFGGWDGKQAVNDAAVFQVKPMHPAATAS